MTSSQRRRLSVRLWGNTNFSRWLPAMAMSHSMLVLAAPCLDVLAYSRDILPGFKAQRLRRLALICGLKVSFKITLHTAFKALAQGWIASTDICLSLLSQARV